MGCTSRKNAQHRSTLLTICVELGTKLSKEGFQNLDHIKTLGGMMLRLYTTRRDKNAARFLISPSTKFFSRSSIQSSLFVVLLFATITSPASATRCDLKNPDSCSFGAICRNIPFHKPMCKCPEINCMRAGMFDPVCGHNGRHLKTYFNVLCLMLEECEKQKPIKQICYGKCKTATCRAISPENQHHSPCPRHDAGKCFNGGLCVHSRSMNESFCRCPRDFVGERCEFRKPEETTDPKQECSQVPNILVITAVILLAAVLIFMFACLCWRKSNKDEKEDGVWPGPSLENGERTPLRDSARSEFIFPRENKPSGSR